MSADLWWSGPAWLKQEVAEWTSEDTTPVDDLPGMKNTVGTVLLTAAEWDLWSRMSNYNKLVKVISLLLKFGRLCLMIPVDDHLLWLEACKIALKKQQLLHFKEDISALANNKNVDSNSRLRGLDVYLENDLLHISGRASCRKLVVLHAKEPVTRLMLETWHCSHGHAGTALLMSIIGQKYWIVGLKSALKNISRHCAKCRQHGRPDVHRMAPLPDYRTELSRAFSITGVDFAGDCFVRRLVS